MYIFYTYSQNGNSIPIMKNDEKILQKLSVENSTISEDIFPATIGEGGD